jgi:hypothetical protein
MKHTLWIAVAASLAACTRPAQDGGPLLVATNVAATLTAVSYLPPTSPSDPTSTPPPSATLPPPPSPTATLTVTPGSSPTPTVPPLPTEDPRYGLNLSQPDYVDAFTERFLWYEFSDPASATNIWDDGRLRASDNVADSYIWWSTSVRQGGDIYTEVSVATETCQGKDGYGLALRVGGENYDRGYSLEFACEGAFRVRKWVSGEAPVTLQDWTAAPAIHVGNNASNRMGFLASGARLAAFANGELLAEWTDEDYVFGTFGLYALASTTPGFTVTFDDFAYWLVSP